MTLWRSVSIFTLVKMQRKSSHEKSASAKLTFVVLSDVEKPSRTFKASRLQLTLLVLFGFVFVGTLSILAMIHTPLGKLILPEYFSTQAEQLEKVRALESKVEDVQKQLSYLTSYNVKLRNALGDTAISSAPNNSNSDEAQVRSQVEQSSDDSEPSQPIESGSKTEYTSTFQSGNSQLPQEDVSSGMFPLMMPASGFVTRSIDYSIAHFGLDISAPEGESIVAPAAGEVLFADWTLTGGNTLILSHPNDFLTVYKHCERILVSVGTRVSRGEAIALVGSTGVTSTGPHLHFELWQNGKNLNPENYLLTKN